MKRSLFQPCIDITDDGDITIDWSDSYVSTYDEDIDDTVYDEPNGQPHSTLLDILVVGVSTSKGLRNLADHIDRQEGNL